MGSDGSEPAGGQVGIPEEKENMLIRGPRSTYQGPYLGGAYQTGWLSGLAQSPIKPSNKAPDMVFPEGAPHCPGLALQPWSSQKEFVP